MHLQIYDSGAYTMANAGMYIPFGINLVQFSDFFTAIKVEGSTFYLLLKLVSILL